MPNKDPALSVCDKKKLWNKTYYEKHRDKILQYHKKPTKRELYNMVEKLKNILKENNIEI